MQTTVRETAPTLEIPTADEATAGALQPLAAGAPALSIRERIATLEARMFEAPQIAIETIHHFAHGIYAREIRIRAGTLLTGKIHRTEHLNIVSQGTIDVLTESGAQRITAPATIVAQPGTKRVGLAITDVVWTTIHATTETDLEKLEAELIAPDYAAIELGATAAPTED